MARAKQTVRAEARRRYRQAQVEPAVGDDGAELDFGERKTGIGAGKASRSNDSGTSDSRAPSGRMGFGAAFRAAYHPAHVREDLQALPSLLRSRAFIGAVLLVVVGAAVSWVFWNFTGGRFFWELTVLPGSALAPQLIAGFFAPRASYLLGLIVGLIQGVAATLFLTQLSARLGTPLPPDQLPNLISQAFLSGPLVASFFAASAAWYRRFLNLSSPRRTAPGRPSSRQPAKSNPSRRAANR